jgi:hypothetical protein
VLIDKEYRFETNEGTASPVLEVVQDERRSHDVERARFEGQWGRDVGHPELHLRPESLARPFDQQWIDIDPDNACAAFDESLRQTTARTGDVEDALPRTSPAIARIVGLSYETLSGSTAASSA